MGPPCCSPPGLLADWLSPTVGLWGLGTLFQVASVSRSLGWKFFRFGEKEVFYYYFPFSFKGQLSSGGDSSISLPLDAHVGTFSLLLKLLQPKSAGLFLRNPNKQ